MVDNQSGFNFNETENKIRKRWLFLSTILPAAILGCFIIISKFTAFTSSNFEAILGNPLFSLLLALAVYLNYHCAYKKQGTILLFLMMLGVPLNLITIFLKQENLALMKVSLFFLLFTLLLLVFEISVFYYSYKLRKINIKIKERKLITSPVYINALLVFSTATNLEELNQQFSRLRTSDDSGSSVEALAIAYNQRKKTVTLPMNNFK